MKCLFPGCNFECVTLQSHIAKEHNMNAEEYKQKFNVDSVIDSDNRLLRGQTKKIRPFACELCINPNSKKHVSYSTEQSFIRHCLGETDVEHSHLIFNEKNLTEWVECKIKVNGETCGFRRKSIAKHIEQVHNMKIEDYKINYGPVLSESYLNIVKNGGKVMSIQTSTKQEVNDDKILATIAGSHAGCTLEQILTQKRQDIQVTGKTIWLVYSHQVSPGMVQKFLKNEKEAYCYLVLADENSSPPTKSQAKQCSIDFQTWFPINSMFKNILPVTGKLGNHASGLVFDNIEDFDANLDLWKYEDQLDSLKSSSFFLGGNTFCAKKFDNGRIVKTAKGRYRKIVARARLCEPYCVFLS